MSAPEINRNGVVIQTFDEIFTQLADGLRDIYGYDINVDQNSPDGQRIGIVAKLYLDLQSYALNLYNSFDPNLSEGTNLDRILKIAGVTREPPTKSLWVLEVTVSSDTTLPNNYVVSDDLNQTWTIAQETPVTVAGSPNNVEFLADNFGSVRGDAGSTITQVTPNLSVTSISAPNAATVGRDEETDAQARQRRQLLIQNPSLGTRAGLQARLLNLNDAIDCIVYENETDDYNPDLDLDAHSIWIVIEGALESEIVDTILKNKSAGCGLKGSIEEILPEGDIIRFDRQTNEPLYIHVDAKRTDPTVALDLELIKRSLSEKLYKIGEVAFASKLYEFGYKAGNTFVLFNLEISVDDVIYTDSNVSPSPDGKLFIDTTNIIVTEIL